MSSVKVGVRIRPFVGREAGQRGCIPEHDAQSVVIRNQVTAPAPLTSPVARHI